MSDFQTIADRVEIEALRGEFTDAAMMRDYDRLASLFTPDGALRMPNIPVELVGQKQIRAWGERVPDLVDLLVQNTHRARSLLTATPRPAARTCQNQGRGPPARHRHPGWLAVLALAPLRCRWSSVFGRSSMCLSTTTARGSWRRVLRRRPGGGRRFQQVLQPSDVGCGLPLEQPGNHWLQRPQGADQAAPTTSVNRQLAEPVGSTRREPSSCFGRS
jgi:hypothetical protein